MALPLTDHQAEAHQALQRFLAIPPTGLATITAWKALAAQVKNPHSDPRILDSFDQQIEGLRKAEMPEE